MKTTRAAAIGIPLLFLALLPTIECSEASVPDVGVMRSAATMTSGFAQVACGGPAAAPYVADIGFVGGSPRTRTHAIDTGSVTNPAPMAVYQSQRFGDFTYTFPGFTAGSANLIRLHFADTHWTTKGLRSFNVSINGTQVLTNFDIVATAGAGDTAVVQTFIMSASTAGAYVIKFTTVKDAATVSGIEIVGTSTVQKRNWLQFGGDSTHAGNNQLEKRITPQNMGQLVPIANFTRLPLTRSPPVILTNVHTLGGVRDVAYVNVVGTLKGFDAGTGDLVFGVVGPPGSTGGEASPAVDPSLQFVYNVAADGCVHKYDVGTGREYTGAGAGVLGASGVAPPACLTNGWPELVISAGLTWSSEQAKTSLTVGIGATTPYLYVGTCNGSGGFGHATAINLTTGAQKTTVGITGTWARGGVTFDPQTQRLYVPTVDGAFTPPTSWGYSVLGFKYDGTGPVDSFTPGPVLGNDWDLGSTNTLVFPSGTTPATYPHLAAQSGKDGYVRLINLDNMSGQGASGKLGSSDPNLSPNGSTSLPSLPSPPVCNPTGGPCPITSPIASWINPADNSAWIFVNSPMGINALKLVTLANGHLSLADMWHAQLTAPVKAGGASVANGVLYYFDEVGLFACNATGPSQTCRFLGQDATAAASHQTPLVVNGILYANGNAFSLGAAPTVDVNLAAGNTATASSTTPGFPASFAVDSSTSTYWASTSTQTTQWITVDLGTSRAIHRVFLLWGANRFSTVYQIQTSPDNASWTTLYQTPAFTFENGNDDDHPGLMGVGRFVRALLSQPSGDGYSVLDFQVWGT